MRGRAAIAHVPEESDAELLARIAEGDTRALGSLYERHRTAVLHFAARASGNLEDADDVTQETFLTVVKIARSFDGRLSCRPWLFGIAARVLSHRRRGFARLARFMAKLASTREIADPNETLVSRFEHPELERALARLSDGKRIVLVMFEVEEMSGEEIALALSIPVGTVWTRLHAARRELRSRLEGAR